MPAALLGALLVPRLLLVGATALLRGTLTPTALTGLLAGPVLLSGTLALTGLALTGASTLAGLSRLPGLLSPATTTALLRRLALLRGLARLRLLGTLAPTSTTLAGRLLLSPTALASLSPLLPA